MLNYLGEKWIIDGLKVDTENGIDNDPDHINLRRRAFGSNKPSIRKKVTFCELLLEALNDFTM